LKVAGIEEGELGYRALGSLCRQRAVFDPDHSWKWLGQAERWEQLGAAEIDSPFTVDHVPNSEVGARPEKGTAAAT
jgi:hypothetical protein